jgi:cytochrome c-type biogenesis protein CcmF
MIPEIGHFCLILALTVSFIQFLCPLAGAHWSVHSWMKIASPAALLQSSLLTISFGCLIYSFLTSDFSVITVYENSHSDKPMLYKFAGVWGNHEGSMMLWVFILGLYGAAVAFTKQSIPLLLKARVLSIQGLIGFGFLLFIILTSNPFLRLNPVPLNGRGLNPILQDPGLAFHPPMLYLGYVGFSMAFSFAIAALLEGRVDAAWARWVRPWTLAAWCSLTLGIAMGSWWAYYTLGWGGWWYWDPVENASLMPWLAGTALLHTATVVEKRDSMKAWTSLLAILTFSLSLLGTFLVRSGILTSVHSFASNPSRGVFVLAILAVFTGGSLLLFALRSHKLTDSGIFAPLSREGGLLINNLLLTTSAGTVLLGTLYPMIADSLGMGKISVGPPFFNLVFIPLMIPLIFAMGIGPHLSWKRADMNGLLIRLRFVFILSLSVSIIGWFLLGGTILPLWSLGGYFLGLWLLLSTLQDFILRIQLFNGSIKDSFYRLKRMTRASLGMTIAHCGMAIIIIGITGATSGKLEHIQVLNIGDHFQFSDFSITLQKVEHALQGPNYLAMRGTFLVEKNGKIVTHLQPEHHQFFTPPQPTTQASIHSTLLGDLYSVIGEEDKAGGYLTRFYKNPLVTWIFMGAILMTIGGLCSLSDRRYRIGAPVKILSHPIKKI